MRPTVIPDQGSPSPQFSLVTLEVATSQTRLAYPAGRSLDPEMLLLSLMKLMLIGVIGLVGTFIIFHFVFFRFWKEGIPGAAFLS